MIQLIGLFLIKIGMLFGWWRIQALPDPRLELPLFFLWYFFIFILYGVALWVIARENGEDSTPLTPTLSVGVSGLHSHAERGNQIINSRSQPRWLRFLLLGVILLGAVEMRLLLFPKTPTLSDDIYRYVWDGRVQSAGIDPYRYAPNAPELAHLRDDLSAKINHPDIRTVYPPLTQWTFRLGAWISPTLLGQKLVFLTCDFLVILFLLLVLKKRNHPLIWVVAYAWNPLVILEVAGSGHNDSLGLALLLAGILAWEYRKGPSKKGTWYLLGRTSPMVPRTFFASVCWSLSFLAKYASLLLVPWVLFRPTLRRWWWLALIVVVTPFLIYSCCIPDFIQALKHVAHHWQFNASGYLLLSSVIPIPPFSRILAILIWLAIAFWAGRRYDDLLHYLFWAVGSAIMLTPLLHPWYLLWIIPLFCFFPNPGWILFSGTIVLSYTVWPRFLAEGIWGLNPWIQVVEYSPFLVWGICMAMKKNWQWLPKRLERPRLPTGSHALRGNQN